MKRTYLNILMALIVVVISLFLTGCEEQTANEEQKEERVIHVESDKEFYNTIDGFIGLPEDAELSDRMKELILDQVSGGDPEIMLKKGFYIEYTQQELNRLEENGETVAEGHAKLYESLGVDPNQSEEEIIKQVEEAMKMKNDDFEKNGPTAVNSGVTFVPHYHEFDNSENPNGYYWCGHANLKGVAKKHGQFKTLGAIHTAFSNNSAAYRNGRCGSSAPYCAAILDMFYAASNNPSKPWNYTLTPTTYETMSSSVALFQKVKDGVDYNKPIIVPSDFVYGSVGHFYTAVGYSITYTSGNQIDYAKTKVYLRDVAKPQRDVFYDSSTTAATFYSTMRGNQVLIVRK